MCVLLHERRFTFVSADLCNLNRRGRFCVPICGTTIFITKTICTLKKKTHSGCAGIEQRLRKHVREIADDSCISVFCTCTYILEIYVK